MEGLIQLAGLVVALGGAGAILARYVVRPLLKVQRGLSDFLEDWNGRPDRPGVPGHKGAMARLEQLENNGGSSIKDTVERTGREVATLNRHFASHLDEVSRERVNQKAVEQELRDAIANLSDAMPIVARSHPPQGDPS